ncbi:MAG: COX15/CtaA family protein [Cyclobacteriaceae bacterium]|nr:COX15/CtaA family protein [Cyclobacteriaceae bacterium]
MRTEKSDKIVVTWLLIGAFLVATMVILGGITRLTQSGLSMVEWKLIMGSVPPMNEAEWQTTFEKYQNFPEYKKLNIHYNLADFKSIFWWEYSHRLLGRVIGIVFLIPFLFFLAKKKLDKSLTIKLVFILLMGAFQGFLGWFMVKSGLVNNPHVSHYRLTAHLVTAFFLFGYIFHLALSIGWPANTKIRIPYYRQVLRLILMVIIAQIVFGAFVAGLKAGLFYPTFPTMNGEWLPVVIHNSFVKDGWSSLVNTVAGVQFVHRWLGIGLWVSLLFTGVVYGPSMAGKTRLSYILLLTTVSVQALLGIFTLLYNVPIALGVLHQFGALTTIMAWVYAIQITKLTNSLD